MIACLKHKFDLVFFLNVGFSLWLMSVEIKSVFFFNRSFLISISWERDDCILVMVRLCICPQLPASVAQLVAPSDWRPGGCGFNPCRGLQHSFVEIDHEIFSIVILSLPLIQEGQFSISGERTCTILVNRLED